MTTTFQRIDVKTAKELLAQGPVTLVDARDAASYALEHIENAIPLNQETLADFLAHADKTKPVLIYCYHGNSSQKAAQYLCDQGFAKVYSLDGGYTAWRSSNTKQSP